ncbi:MAG: NAD-dependent epimerase/dehydratase family protein [Rhodospirillales bacterium]
MAPGPEAGVVALTGASGFVGQALATALVRCGWRVRALARRPESVPGPPGVEVVPGALEDADSLRRLVAGTTAVVHCAGAVKARRAADFYAVNAAGTARLAAVAAERDPPPRLLAISSLAAREPALGPYADSKSRAERELRRHAPRLPYCIVRPPAVYGPGDRATLTLFRQLARGFAIVPAGRDRRFSLIFVDDLAAAVVRLLDTPRWGGSPIELDDGREGGYAWREIATIAAEVLGRRVRCIAVPFPVALAPVALAERLAALAGGSPMVTTAKLRELFHPDWVSASRAGTPLADWRPATAFKEGFGRTVLWYKQAHWL